MANKQTTETFEFTAYKTVYQCDAKGNHVEGEFYAKSLTNIRGRIAADVKSSTIKNLKFSVEEMTLEVDLDTLVAAAMGDLVPLEEATAPATTAEPTVDAYDYETE